MPTEPTSVSAGREPELLGQTVVLIGVNLMIDTAVTGATYDIDGGQQHVGA